VYKKLDTKKSGILNFSFETGRVPGKWPIQPGSVWAISDTPSRQTINQTTER